MGDIVGDVGFVGHEVLDEVGPVVFVGDAVATFTIAVLLGLDVGENDLVGPLTLVGEVITPVRVGVLLGLDEGDTDLVGIGVSMGPDTGALEGEDVVGLVVGLSLGNDALPTFGILSPPMSEYAQILFPDMSGI